MINLYWFGATPLELLGTTLLLARLLSARAALAGVLVAVVMCRSRRRGSAPRRVLRKRTAARSEQRVARTKEALVAIKSIKALGWEDRAAGALHRCARPRPRACSLAGHQSGAVLLFFATTPTAAFAMFATHRASGRELRLVDVYPALALLQVVRQSVGKQLLAGLACESAPECHVTVRRLQRFLELPEVAPRRAATTPTRTAARTAARVGSRRRAAVNATPRPRRRTREKARPTRARRRGRGAC